ncbi:MAG: sodium:solute symporter, partial [Lewinella sp.]
VYTAYEYLEGRFDLRVRTLTALLFLLQRGLAAGITIYAPAIVLSTILNWPLSATILVIGAVVIFYTVLGGTKAVSVTQKQQMIVILIGMFIAGVVVVLKLPEGIGFSDAIGVAGHLGKLQVIDLEFNLDDRYNIWSAMLGGTFLFLSYFGTDQSQVQRYLSGKSLAESRLGLLFNGIFKVPMQFLVLMVGILVFVFFLFQPPPVHFNSANLDKLRASEYQPQLEELEANYLVIGEENRVASVAMAEALRREDEPAIAEARTEVERTLQERDNIATAVDSLIGQFDPELITEDRDYVFITFIINYLPVGLVGLLLAVIFSAAMSSTSSELNALATTSVVDIYRRSLVTDRDDAHYLAASKWFTIGWGIVALCFAAVADLFDNLIQAVNIIGSLFYGAILGIFVVAFFFKRVGGKAVFKGALLGQLFVSATFVLSWMGKIDLAFLWLNLIGCVLTVVFALIFENTDKAATLTDPKKTMQ